MRLIDADAMVADLLTVDPQFESMKQWCITVVDAQPTIELSLKAIKKQIDEHWYLDKNDDLISRADALKKWDDLSERGRTEFDQVLMTLPSADRPQGDISEDGTLKVNVTDGAKVKRVLVLGGNNFGGLYYPE